MTVVVSGGSGTIQLSMAVKLRWINRMGQCYRHRFNYCNFTPPYSSRHNLLQGTDNAANNGCDQAISNNAVAVISPDLLVTTQPTM
jgi:hypothetical protein